MTNLYCSICQEKIGTFADLNRLCEHYEQIHPEQYAEFGIMASTYTCRRLTPRRALLLHGGPDDEETDEAGEPRIYPVGQ